MKYPHPVSCFHGRYPQSNQTRNYKRSALTISALPEQPTSPRRLVPRVRHLRHGCRHPQRVPYFRDITQDKAHPLSDDYLVTLDNVDPLAITAHLRGADSTEPADPLYARSAEVTKLVDRATLRGHSHRVFSIPQGHR